MGYSFRVFSYLVLRISLRPRTRPLFPLCITAISQQSLINFTCCIWTMCFWKSPLWRKSSCTTMSKEVSGMVILKYELKRHRTYILGWTIALAVCIFLMTPTYYSFLDVASVELFETMPVLSFSSPILL